MKGINIFLADGFEDMEALAVNDVLRRSGLDVCLVGIGEDPFVVSSHGVTVGPEAYLADFDEDHTGTLAEDFMIFPGGMPGTKNLAACEALVRAMREHYAEGGSLAAICAAPGLVLSQLPDVSGLQFTCFDGFQDALIAKGASFVNAPAVKSGRIITGRSAGHAVAFGLEVLKAVKGAEAAEKVRYSLLLDTK